MKPLDQQLADQQQVSYTCARTRQLKLESYDRLFPNQDTLPKGGFGNLIALPLQKETREKDFSLFVDDELKPHADQWALLAAVRPMSQADLESAILRATIVYHDVHGRTKTVHNEEGEIVTYFPGSRRAK